jgi:hypothetical protein
VVEVVAAEVLGGAAAAAAVAPRCVAVAEHGPVAVRDPEAEVDIGVAARVPAAVVTRTELRQCRDPVVAAGHQSMFQAADGRRWDDFRRRALALAADKLLDPAAEVVLVAGRSRVRAAGRFRDPVAGKLLVVLAVSPDPAAEGDLHNVTWITSSTLAVPAAAADSPVRAPLELSPAAFWRVVQRVSSCEITQVRSQVRDPAQAAPARQDTAISPVTFRRVPELAAAVFNDLACPVI